MINQSFALCTPRTHHKIRKMAEMQIYFIALASLIQVSNQFTTLFSFWFVLRIFDGLQSCLPIYFVANTGRSGHNVFHKRSPRNVNQQTEYTGDHNNITIKKLNCYWIGHNKQRLARPSANARPHLRLRSSIFDKFITVIKHFFNASILSFPCPYKVHNLTHENRRPKPQLF